MASQNVRLKIRQLTEQTARILTNPLILNIEAATDVCSVCLSRGMEVLSLQESVGQNEHSRVITLLIQRCMTEAGLQLSDLDAVSISEGPGSYTSLRVGFSTAKGICYALNKPLITVSTLAALATAAKEVEQDSSALYCPMIDARRMEVYTALFDAEGKLQLEAQPMVIEGGSFEDYFRSGQRIIFCGNGAEKCEMVLNNPLATFSSVKRCAATQIISHAMNSFLNKNFSDSTYSLPVYMKTPNITSPRPKPS